MVRQRVLVEIGDGGVEERDPLAQLGVEGVVKQLTKAQHNTDHSHPLKRIEICLSFAYQLCL